MSGKESHDVHESEEVFKADRNASWVKSRELAESWPVRGTHWGVPRIELGDWGLLIIIQQRQVIINISLRHHRLNSHQCITSI